MGLLDGNLDPQTIGGLMMLLTRHGQGPQNLSQIATMVEADKRRKLSESEEKRHAEMQALQRQQMERQMQEQQQIQQLGRQAFAPNQNLVNRDDEGNAMPSSGGGGMGEFAQGMMGIDPFKGIGLQAQMAAMQAKSYQKLGEGEQLFDMSNPGAPIASGAPKARGPQPGAIREIKSGGQIFTYEFDGKEWKKIASAPQFKGEAPEKPDKPPQGYRFTQDGQLAFIPGGPADPQRPGAKTQEHPTEDERRSAGLTVRLESALKTIKANPTAGKPEVIPSAIRAATLGNAEAIPNVLTSSARQQVESAQLDALDAALTLATGAAYTKDQLQNLRKSYFPQMGDTKATVAEKEKRFAEVIETARIRAGRAAKTIDPVLQGKSQPQGWSIKPLE